MADFWTDRQDGDIIEADEFNMAFSEIDKKMKTNANENTQTAKTLSTHISDESNPHNVTAEQTGAYEKDSVYNKTEIDSKLVPVGTSETDVDLTTCSSGNGTTISENITSNSLAASVGTITVTLDADKTYVVKGTTDSHGLQLKVDGVMIAEATPDSTNVPFEYSGKIGVMTAFFSGSGNVTFETFKEITPRDGFMTSADKAKLDRLPDDAYSKHETDSKIDLLSLKAEKNGEALRISDACEWEQTSDVTLTSDAVTDFSSVAVKKYGKNLIPYPYAETTRTDNGITFTDNGDGSITANGTATELAVFHLCYTKAVPDVIGQTVTLSGCPSGGAETTYRLRYQQGSISSDIGNGATFTVAVKGQVAIQFFAGQTANNLVFKPQLELGNAVTDYELYKAPVTYTADSDGKVSGVTLGSDTATLTTDTDGVIINAKYKKDITKAFAQLEEKINSLSSASTVANIETL